MWTNENRARYNRDHLRYPSDLTDDEWALVEPFIPPPKPGGNACVPRVPDAAQGYRRTKCGNMWDALKWEYRMETAFTGYGMWFFAARGWGDLPEGTAVSWPAPYQELQVRQVPIYGLGGVGLPGGSGRGNYGLFDGGVYGW